MKNLILLLIVHYSLFIGHCLCQSFTWNRTFDGPLHVDDAAFDICQSTDGYLFAAGYTSGILRPAYILKLNPLTGDTVWSSIISNGVAYAVTRSDDGGCVYTGGSGQSFVVKLDYSGSVVWQRFYGGSGRACYDIIQTSDGGYIACGRSSIFQPTCLK